MCNSVLTRAARFVAVAVVVAGMTIGVAPAAQAAPPGQVYMEYAWRMTYVAAAGQSNNVVVTQAGAWIYVDDVYALTVGTGCVAVFLDPTKVGCPADPINAIVINSGNNADTITVAASVDESITTSLLGGTGNDSINGGSGLDGMWGNEGADVINGGDGVDAAMYNESSRLLGVRVDLDGATGDDGEAGEGDTVASDVESLYGTAHADILIGNASNNQIVGDGYLPGATGDDKLYGLAGSDTLTGGPGNDLLDGGQGGDIMQGEAGIDTVSYAGRVEEITADLDGVFGDDGAAGEGDSIEVDVENLTGGRGDDTLTGNAAGNVLDGGLGVCTLLGPCTTGGEDTLSGLGGNDRLEGRLGADVLIGGSGIDFADYATRTAAIVADIDNAADDGALGEGDTIDTTVEGILGGSGNDTLTGSSGDNLLSGGPGSDSLYGLAGDDILDGVSGMADFTDGASGTDTCVNTDSEINCE